MPRSPGFTQRTTTNRNSWFIEQKESTDICVVYESVCLKSATVAAESWKQSVPDQYVLDGFAQCLGSYRHSVQVLRMYGYWIRRYRTRANSVCPTLPIRQDICISCGHLSVSRCSNIFVVSLGVCPLQPPNGSREQPGALTTNSTSAYLLNIDPEVFIQRRYECLPVILVLLSMMMPKYF